MAATVRMFSRVLSVDVQAIEAKICRGALTETLTFTLATHVTCIVDASVTRERRDRVLPPPQNHQGFLVNVHLSMTVSVQ